MLAALLVGSGALLFLQKRFTFFVAFGAAALLALSGLVASLGHPELTLPVPPALSIVIGLYLCLRVVIARPARPRGGNLPPPETPT